MTTAPRGRPDNAGRYEVLLAGPGTDQVSFAVDRLLASESTRLITSSRLLITRAQGCLQPRRRTRTKTYWAFMRQLWTSVHGTDPDGFGKFDIELHSFVERLARISAPAVSRAPLLVIQGQQLPTEFFELLHRLRIPTTVVVDVHSPVPDEGSATTEICAALGVDAPEPLDTADPRPPGLRNFLNLTALTPPVLHSTALDDGAPILVGHADIADEARFAIDYAHAHPNSVVGIILPSAKMLDHFREQIREAGELLQWYRSDADIPAQEQLDFRTPGLKAVLWQSAPGLSFPHALLAGLDAVDASRLSEHLNVLARTAVDQLVLSYSGRGEPTALSALPNHVLERRNADDIRADRPCEPLDFLSHPDDDLEPDVAEVPPRCDADSDIAAARAVLAADRRVHPRNRTRVLLAQEEVGLMRLLRGHELRLNQPLPRGFRSTVNPASEAAAAFDAMVTHNDGLVRTRARRMQHSRIEEDDLHQIGMLGLMRAIEKFDGSLGNKFSTYATWWIDQSLMRMTPEHTQIIRLPSHVCEKLRKIRSASAQLQEQGIPPTCDEIARVTSFSRKDVERYLRASTVGDLDAPVREGSELLVGQLVGLRSESGDPDQLLERRAVQELVHSALAQLTARDIRILRLRFGFDNNERLTLDQVGERFALTRERIRQLEKRAKIQLKKLIESFEHPPQATPPSRSVTMRRSSPSPPGHAPSPTRQLADGDIATGSDLDVVLGDPPPFNVADVVRELIVHAASAGAQRVLVRAGKADSGHWIGVVQDGDPAVQRSLRDALRGLAADDDPATPVLAAATHQFDELVMWERIAHPHCRVLTLAPRTGNWWLRTGKEIAPEWMCSTRTTDACSAILLRVPRRGHQQPSPEDVSALVTSQIGLVLGDLIGDGRITIVVNGVEAPPRTAFLWDNPAAQNFAGESVVRAGHRVRVKPHVLPHPDALRPDERTRVGAPETWTRTQGFHIRCADRYLVAGGWCGLPGLNDGPTTALARVLVDVSPGQEQKWAPDRDGHVSIPPPLRSRLIELAELARRRSENVLNRRQEKTT